MPRSIDIPGAFGLYHPVGNDFSFAELKRYNDLLRAGELFSEYVTVAGVQNGVHDTPYLKVPRVDGLHIEYRFTNETPFGTDISRPQARKNMGRSLVLDPEDGLWLIKDLDMEYKNFQHTQRRMMGKMLELYYFPDQLNRVIAVSKKR